MLQTAITLGQHHFRTAIIERSVTSSRVGETLLQPFAISSPLLVSGNTFLQTATSNLLRSALLGAAQTRSRRIISTTRMVLDGMLIAPLRPHARSNCRECRIHPAHKAHIKRISKDHGSGWEIEVCNTTNPAGSMPRFLSMPLGEPP